MLQIRQANVDDAATIAALNISANIASTVINSVLPMIRQKVRPGAMLPSDFQASQ